MYHDGPKVPKSSTVIVILSIFQIKMSKSLLRYKNECASVMQFYEKPGVLEKQKQKKTQTRI